MKIDQLYPATYLKAADLGNSRVQVTMSKITLEDVGNGEMKPCLHFLNKDKGMILNKTNGLIVAQSFGDETDGWIGQTIELYAHMVNFQGKMVQGLAVACVRPVMPSQPPARVYHSEPPGGPPVSQSAGHQAQPATLMELNKQPGAHLATGHEYKEKLEQDISAMSEVAQAAPNADGMDDIPF